MKIFKVRIVGKKLWNDIEAHSPEYAVCVFANEEFYMELSNLPDVEVKGHGKWGICPEVEYSAYKK